MFQNKRINFNKIKKVCLKTKVANVEIFVMLLLIFLGTVGITLAKNVFIGDSSDNTGNVGISTTNPQAKLDIFTTSSSDYVNLVGLSSDTNINGDGTIDEYAGKFIAHGNNANRSFGIYAKSSDSYNSASAAVFGDNNNGYGLWGYSNNNYGIFGDSNSNVGIFGHSVYGQGLYGTSETNDAVFGYSPASSAGVNSYSQNGYGLYTYSNSGTAIYAYSNSSYAAVFAKGNVGIGKNPSYALDVVGDINLTGALRVNGNPFGGTAKYATSTAATNGNVDGYGGANALCAAKVSGSHLCTGAEIMYTINSGSSSSIPNGVYWISNGPPGSTVNSNDCNGWTDGTTTYFGPTWSKSSGDGRGYVLACNISKPMACCK